MPPSRSLTPEAIGEVVGRLRTANLAFSAAYPGESGDRQAVHTVYGGAHLFKADTARKMGQIAQRTLEEYYPNPLVLGRALGLQGAERLPTDADEAAQLLSVCTNDLAAAQRTSPAAWMAATVHSRVIDKLKREAVEDFRIDFEDGYGNRPDAEEDGHAVQSAEELARGLASGSLPPFIGIRIKPFTEELRERSMRTLDIFVTTLAEKSERRVPDHFVVTLPKVVIPEQVSALAELLTLLETKTGVPAGSLKIELMIETTQSIVDVSGRLVLPALVRAAGGRCVGAHFGTYDYTAGYGITAAYQGMTHSACDFAKHMMKVALAGTGIALSDGATNVMPVPRHRVAKDGPALTPEQILENRTVVHAASRLHYDQIRHSLENGFYQGWDLHPAQLITRYAAVFAFFLEGLDTASLRLKNFMEKAAQATLVGDVFDDAATGQGLLNFFLRGMSCGALTLDEARKTGLTLDEFRTRSFAQILNGRRKA
jgi:citrate lyase beta subunit